MKLAKVTISGRVTIPAPLRKKYNLTLGKRIKFEIAEDGIHLIPLVTKNEVRMNAGFLGTKGKLLKALVEEKKREIGSECKNILAGTAIDATGYYADKMKDKKEIISFAEKHLKNRRNRTRKKADKFLTRSNNRG